MSLDTPAGRLLAVFDKVRAISGDREFRMLWAAALQCNVGSSDEAARMAEVVALLRQVHVVSTGVANSGAVYDESALLHEYPSWSAAVFGWNITVASGHVYNGTSLVSATARSALSATHSILRAAVCEGVFLEQSRDDLLNQVYSLVSQVLDEISDESGVPEPLRVRLTAMLVEVRETVLMVQYRGDQAVANAVQYLERAFDDAANRDQHEMADGKSWLQERLEGWSESIRRVSMNVRAAVALPTAAIYYVGTRDPIGTGIIVATGSPEVIEQVKGVLKNKPLAIEGGGAPVESPPE